MSSAATAQIHSANAPTHPSFAMWWALGLIAPMLVYAAHAAHIIANPAVPFDALHTYLPLARAFLDDPGGYFSLPASVTVAPGAVLYMALWAADPVTIKSANLFLGMLSLLLASDAARRVAGRTAAAAAAWGFALSPMLISIGITLMGEAPFVFWVVAWLWACSYAAQCDGATPARRTAAAVFGGLCLAAATLTRGTWLYWLPAATLAGLAMSIFSSGGLRAVWTRLTLVHAIGLLLVGAFMAHQTIEFDRPMIATGSGAALYFGSNPVLHGYEPPFFGLSHDEFTVTDHLGHLSLAGDARLSAVTREALRDMPSSTLLAMYSQKLAAFLFFSRVHLDKHVLNERALRVVLLVLAITAWALGRRRPIIWMLAGAVAYQCAVHIPVMYNPRYSASALDPALTLLAAAGVGMLMSQTRRARTVVCAGVLLSAFAGIGFGVWHQRNSTPPMPDLTADPHRLVQAALPAELSTDADDGDPFAGPITLGTGQLRVSWQPENLDLSSIAVLGLKVPQLEGKCRELWITYTEPRGATRGALVRLEGWKAPQTIAWGMNAVRLPDHTGRLTLDFKCEPGTVIRLGEMGLYDVSLGRHYRAEALGPALAQPIAVEDK